MKKKLLPFLMSAAVFAGIVGSQIYGFDSSASAVIDIQESGTAYRGEDVSVHVKAELNGQEDIAGLQVDFGYSSNFPDVTTVTTTDTTGWGLKPNLAKKNLAGAALGVTLTADAVIEGDIMFTVPEDAEIGEEYTINITYVEVTSSSGEIRSDYEVVNDSVTITVVDLPEIEGISVSGYTGVYDGEVHSLDVVIPSEASISYGTAEGAYSSDALSYTDAGDYEVFYQITQDGHKSLEGSEIISISKKELTADMISDIGDVSYTGSQIKPDVTVSDGSPSIIDADDYSISYGDNVNSGTGTVTVTANSDGNYTGEAVKSFNILKADITYTTQNYSGTYDGTAHTGSFSVSAPTGVSTAFGTSEGTYDLSVLPEYTNAGTYVVYYKAESDNENYNVLTGSITIAINPKEVTANMISDVADADYTGSKITPDVTVSDGNLLTEDDFTLSYGNNTSAAEGGSVTITGKNNYTGTASKSFAINKAALNVSAESLTITYGESANISISYTGFVGSDTESVIKTKASAEGIAAVPSAGTYSIVLSGAEADNYDFTYSTGAVLTVDKKYVSITSLSIADKTYDGTTDGEIDADSVVLDGVLSGDDVTVTASSIIFESAEIGSDIPVVISGITLSGADAANYTLTTTSFETTGTIVEEIIETSTETTTAAKSSSSGGGGGSGVVLYTIKFETNGGSDVSNKSASKNSTLQAALKNVVDPEKEGCIFEGWYTDEDLTEAVDLSSRLTASITLYAKWSGETDTAEESVEDTTETSGETEASADNKIIMTIDSVIVSIFGEENEIDVPPVIVNSRTMLPARFVLESLGAKLDWDAANKKVTITKDDMEIIIYIGSETAYINGEEVTLDSPAFISNDRTYLPVRFISEGVGANVEWNEADRQVIIIP